MTGGLSVVRCRSDALRSIISRRNASIDGIAQPRAGGVPPVGDGPAGRGGRRSVSFASLHARRETGWNKIVPGPVRCSRGFAALRSSDAPGPRRLARPLSRSASAALHAAWPGSAARLRRAARGLAGSAARLRRAARGLAGVRCSPPPRRARLGGAPLLAFAALRAAWPGPLLASAALRAAGGDA